MQLFLFASDSLKQTFQSRSLLPIISLTNIRSSEAVFGLFLTQVGGVNLSLIIVLGFYPFLTQSMRNISSPTGFEGNC